MASPRIARGVEFALVEDPMSGAFDVVLGPPGNAHRDLRRAW